LLTSGGKVNVPGWGFGVSTTSSYYKKADGFSLNSPWMYYPAPPSNRQLRHHRCLSLHVVTNLRYFHKTPLRVSSNTHQVTSTIVNIVPSVSNY